MERIRTLISISAENMKIYKQYIEDTGLSFNKLVNLALEKYLEKSKKDVIDLDLESEDSRIIKASLNAMIDFEFDRGSKLMAEPKFSKSFSDLQEVTDSSIGEERFLNAQKELAEYDLHLLKRHNTNEILDFGDVNKIRYYWLMSIGDDGFTPSERNNIEA